MVMYKALDHNYDILNICIYKDLTVKHFRRFLDKVITIVMEDRENNDIFISVGIDMGVHEIVPELVGLVYYEVLLLLLVNYGFTLMLAYQYYHN